MGFFKRLKERVFTLKGVESSKQNKKEKEEEIILNNKEKIEEQKQILLRRKKQKKVDKYVAGLDKTGSSFAKRIQELQSKNNKIDEEFFDELEDVLVMSDISVPLVMEIIDEIKREVKIENVDDPKLISEIIADKMFAVYTNKSIVDTTLKFEKDKLNVYVMVGVNGAGKTTTIAKIANKMINEGKKVLIAAGDTFRAGAVEQLEVWANRVNASIVKPSKEGADPVSVVFDSLKIAKKNNYDVLIIDTAGRLQNKVNLMNELAKMYKVIKRETTFDPQECLLVLDATTGQNGVSQAKHFKEVAPLTGIVLTKMDGTSKGGIVLTIKDELELPVKFIGLGEKMDDLQEFDLDSFIYGMTKELIND